MGSTSWDATAAVNIYTSPTSTDGTGATSGTSTGGSYSTITDVNFTSNFGDGFVFPFWDCFF